MINDMTSLKFRVFDFDITYFYRPNDDIYQALVPKELNIHAMVPKAFRSLSPDVQLSSLKMAVIEALSDVVMFDTPDVPEFEISDVGFSFEETH